MRSRKGPLSTKQAFGVQRFSSFVGVQWIDSERRACGAMSARGSRRGCSAHLLIRSSVEHWARRILVTHPPTHPLAQRMRVYQLAPLAYAQRAHPLVKAQSLAALQAGTRALRGTAGLAGSNMADRVQQ